MPGKGARSSERPGQCMLQGAKPRSGQEPAGENLFGTCTLPLGILLTFPAPGRIDASAFELL